jgi:hypothetical protein
MKFVIQINIWLKQKFNKIVKNNMLNRLIKKKNLPIIRLKMVKYTHKWLIFILKLCSEAF